MSLVAHLLLAAAAAASPAPAEAAEGRGEGAQVAEARVAARIVRPAVLRDGAIVSADAGEARRPQTLRRDGRVTYEYE